MKTVTTEETFEYDGAGNVVKKTTKVTERDDSWPAPAPFTQPTREGFDWWQHPGYGVQPQVWC